MSVLLLSIFGQDVNRQTTPRGRDASSRYWCGYFSARTAMETPPKSSWSTQGDKTKYTEEEKQQLLANLDLEGMITVSDLSSADTHLHSTVEHRTRQFEASLADILENFRNHHEGQVLRVPRLVRSITMAEFGDKYNGDINECLKGLQMERHGGEPVPLDAVARKRKWQESQDDATMNETDPIRTNKNGKSDHHSYTRDCSCSSCSTFTPNSKERSTHKSQNPS